MAQTTNHRNSSNPEVTIDELDRTDETDVMEITPTNSIESLWDRSADLFIQARNGIVQAFFELEDISKNEDLICMCYFALIMIRNRELHDKDKSNRVNQQIQEKVTQLIQTTMSNSSFEEYVSKLKNKHEQYIFGYIYDEGIGVEKNPSKAFELFSLSAEHGFVLAECTVGYCYSLAFGVSKDEELSVQYYLRAITKGYSVAQYNLGLHYEDGRGVEKNLVEALRWYHLAASQGYVDAIYNLGYCYEHGRGVDKQMSEALKWYQKAADRGYQRGQFAVGWCYLQGEGVEKNEAIGLEWYKKSADSGYAYAQYCLGYHLITGDDESTHEEGYDYILKAAENGYSEAQYHVGIQYYTGDRVSVNEDEAIKWIQLSANQGDWRGLFMIGECHYHHRHNIEETEERISYKLFEKASTDGSTSIKYSIIMYYLQDEKEPANQTKGFERLNQMNSNPNVQYRDVRNTLGMCYEHGLGVQRDLKEAFKLYSNSSELLYTNAHYDLGRCHEEGIGTEQNSEEAKRLYLLAAEGGHLEAKMKLNLFEEDKVRVKFRKRKYF